MASEHTADNQAIHQLLEWNAKSSLIATCVVFSRMIKPFV